MSGAKFDMRTQVGKEQAKLFNIERFVIENFSLRQDNLEVEIPDELRAKALLVSGVKLSNPDSTAIKIKIPKINDDGRTDAIQFEFSDITTGRTLDIREFPVKIMLEKIDVPLGIEDVGLESRKKDFELLKRSTTETNMQIDIQGSGEVAKAYHNILTHIDTENLLDDADTIFCKKGINGETLIFTLQKEDRMIDMWEIGIKSISKK